MSLIDWIVTIFPLLVVLAIGIYSNRFVRSVADFMSANRSAGRYLLCIAGGELQAGAVVFVAAFEIFSHAGFTVGWWWTLNSIIGLVLTTFGFVSYRYRETRAMTLAQFFEIRYDKSFRIFSGAIGFFAGILNFGIIPALGARTLVYFLGLPENARIFSVTMPAYIPLMAIFLGITLFVALSGGVITVMIVNTMEGIISQLFYVVIILTLLSMFSWSQMHDTLIDRTPGHSLVNPFDTADARDFNLWYVLMGIFTASVYGRMAWQNAGAYNSAGLTPHEGRMAGILTNWREMGKNCVITLLALCAITYLHHPDFATGAAQVHEAVHRIADPQVREQMEAPIALAHLMPVGIRGVFCALLLMGIFGGDATHLHSWGSIFVQDILVPLRRTPFGPRAHLWALRASITGVACFAFLFGVFFHMTDFINMWWAVTMTIFVGGAGSAIIGGLYWKKGTAAGAWAAFVTGSVLSVGGIAMQQIYAHRQATFPLNGTQIGFFACLIAVGVYVVVSLLTCKEDFNLDRMLHRGAYAREADASIKHGSPFSLGQLVGIDENFTRGDKWITGLMFGWSMFWLAVFVVGTLWNLAAPWSTETWVSYSYCTGVSLPLFFAVVTGVWFTWGGIRDMRDLFRRLGQQRVNHLDDGTVLDHRNLDEAPTTGKGK